MSIIGSTPAELEAAALDVEQAADWVARSGADLSRSLGSLSWAGAAALQFTDTWSSRHKPALVSTESFLRDQAARLRRQSQQQRAASETVATPQRLRAAVGQGVDLRPAPHPPRGDAATPSTSHDWWASLDDGQQAWVVASHPDWVRNLDGVPAWARDEANRAVIERELDRLRAEHEDYHARGQKLGGLFTNDDRRAELIALKIQSLEAVKAALKDRPDAQLLLLDVSGSTVLAAVGLGDLDEARDVAVYTGGVGTDVAGGLGGAVDRMTELRERSGAKDVATVAWLGYEAPPDFEVTDPATWYSAGTDADDLNKARVGASSLSGFLQGVDLSRGGDVHITAIGHSYGSAVSAIAASQTPPGVIDELVVMGSPGLGTPSVNVPPGHVFMLEAEGDPIADLGNVDGYGGDPAFISGITQLDASDSHGHSEYLKDGSRSQAEIARVVTSQR